MHAEGDVIRFPTSEQEPSDFTAFFAEEHRELFKALFFVTGNRADAAELMQDAFLKLWERWDQIDRIADPRGYLFRVALNGFRMRARAARRATRRLVPVTTSYDPFDEVNLREDVSACCSNSHRANAPPSSCSTSTATARRRPRGSWGSAPPPSERSQPRAEPCSEPQEARMPELREVFEMTTKQVEPDADAWREQEKHQRRSSRNKRIGAFAVAAAIGIVAVVVVIRAADEGTGTQPGGEPTDTTGIPTAEAIPPLPGGVVEPGRYVFSSGDPGLDASHRITIDVPEGYVDVDGLAVLKSGTSQTSVGTAAIEDVYANACRWEGTALDRSAISSAEGVAAALASQKGLRVSTPTDVTVDGFSGTYMERRVPARTDLAECDRGQFRVYEVTVWGERYLVRGLLSLLWIIDVDGVPLVIEAALDAGTSAQVRAELLRMVESIQIDPR
jgi:hypothetical protein